MIRMMRKQESNPEKFIGYFKLTEFFPKKGCPICSKNHESAYNYLDNLFYENVNDSEVREILINSFGFCKEHSQLLLQIGDSLGTAIIYADLLVHFEQTLDQNKLNNFSNRNGCNVCNLIAEETKNYIQIFLAFHTDKEFRNEFYKSDGLCATHLVQLLKNCQSVEQKTFYLSFHKKKIELLKNKLGELIRKNDYRFKAEKITESEGKSWTDAVNYLNNFIDKLIKALNHPEPETPIRAANILSQLNVKEAVPFLIKKLKREKDPFIIKAIVDALVNIDLSGTKSEIIKILSQSTPVTVKNLLKKLENNKDG